MPLYKRKPLIVEAHQMTVGLRDQEILARWCHGSLCGTPVLPSKRFIQVPLGQEAQPGDWIVKEADVYRVYEDSYFELTHTLQAKTCNA